MSVEGAKMVVVLGAMSVAVGMSEVERECGCSVVARRSEWVGACWPRSRTEV